METSKWRGSLIAYAPVFLWIGVIFFLSSDQGAMTQTSRFVGPLLHLLFPTAPEETIQLYHFYIRKAAHLTEYAILAFLAWRAFSLSSLTALRRYRYPLPIVLVGLISSLDEFNQSFEASRTSSPWDVLLDISGGSAAIVAIWAILSLRRKTVAPRSDEPEAAGP